MSRRRDADASTPPRQMTPDRWRAIDAILKGALEREPSERAAFLGSACAGDASLLREVESLLAADRADDGFLERLTITRPDITDASLGAGHDAEGEGERGAAPPSALAAAVEGRYAIVRELGHGGMATVHLARDLRHRRDVAIKALRPRLAAQVGAARFLREIEVVANLQHPHILPLFDSGAADGVRYYVMPYVAGGSLRDRLGRDGPLPVADAVRLTREVALALACAHRRGLVHRDVKPENVLLSEDAHALVADFGIARAVDRSARDDGTTGAPEALTNPGLVIGTPAYMAPEQAVGHPDTDHRADLYALGIVAYELLAGTHPFAGRSSSAMLAAHLREAPEPLRMRRPDAPPALAALVMRLLAKLPEDRPQSATEVVRLLDEAAATTPADGPAVHERIGRLASRLTTRRSAAAVVALVAVGVITAVTAVALRWSAAAPVQPVLVVLPFENVGAPGDAYFADGLTDEVTTRLALVSAMRVIGRASARQYKGSTRDPRDIARELGATHLLTGTVRWERSSDGTGRVRVSPELVRASDRATVWAKPYEGPLEDVFRVQAIVAEEVAAALDVALRAGERRIVTARPTANVAAYDAYLRGLAGLARPARQSSAVARDAAIAEIERAVSLDPSFAAAHARLAEAYLATHAVTGDDARLARARASVERAWELDSALIDSRLARARFLMASGDPAGAYRVARAAVAAAPGQAEAHFRLAEVEEALGQVESAIASAQRAAVLDPRSPEAPAVIAGLYHMTSRYAQSVEYREREIALGPDNAAAYFMQALCHLAWRADTVAARRVVERGGPPLEDWLVRIPNETGMQALFHAVLGPAVWQVRDTLSLTGYLAGGGGFPPDLFYRMKLRHFERTGRPDRARAYADTIVARLAPALRLTTGTPDLLLFGSSSRRSMLAEAYAAQGRLADATRESARALAEARRRGPSDALATALLDAARVELLAGRSDSAVARLEEALRLPSGEFISRAVLRADASWAALRGHPAFERLVAGG